MQNHKLPLTKSRVLELPNWGFTVQEKLSLIRPMVEFVETRRTCWHPREIFTGTKEDDDEV